MANLPSVEKRNRQSLKRKARNVVVRTQVKGALKAARSAIAGKKPADVAKALQEAMRVVGKAKSKGVMHPRTAARRIARLAKSAAGALKK
jgi:small subunit ribosomal protein S20